MNLGINGMTEIYIEMMLGALLGLSSQLCFPSYHLQSAANEVYHTITEQTTKNAQQVDNYGSQLS